MKLHLKETVLVLLRYLCTSDSQVFIGTSYRISSTIMRRIHSDTCWAIWYNLNKKGFIKAPTSKKKWLDIATEFDNKWNFPHCFGAIDGKHITIQAPPRGVLLFSIIRNHLVLFYSPFSILITSSYLLILVKLADKVMERSTTN